MSRPKNNKTTVAGVCTLWLAYYDALGLVPDKQPASLKFAVRVIARNATIANRRIAALAEGL